MSVLDLARPEIRAMQPYSSARMEASGGQILLNANESAWAPFGEAGAGCNRYPDPQPPALVDALRKEGADHILVVVGGVIPQQDYEFLKKAGASAIFGPGTNIPAAASEILTLIREQAKQTA